MRPDTKFGLIMAAVIALVAGVIGFTIAKSKYSQSTASVNEVNHTRTQIVEVKKPNGDIQTVTTIDSNTKTKSLVQVAAVKLAKTNISLLISNDFSRNGMKPVYGLSVSKEVFGPITAGVFINTNSVIGVSIGMNF